MIGILITLATYQCLDPVVAFINIINKSVLWVLLDDEHLLFFDLQ